MRLVDGRGGPPRRGDRFDDRRGSYGGGGWRRRDDGYDRYGGRYDSYDRGRDSRDDYGYRGGSDRYGGGREGYRGGSDRYGGGREDRYSREDRRDDRRSYHDRDANPPSYDAAPPREARDAYAGRSYEGRGEERYASR